MFKWTPYRNGRAVSESPDDLQVRIRCSICQTLIGTRTISRRALQTTRLRAYCARHLPHVQQGRS